MDWFVTKSCVDSLIFFHTRYDCLGIKSKQRFIIRQGNKLSNISGGNCMATIGTLIRTCYN